MSEFNFNANDVDPSVGFQPIPAGKYVAVINDSEMKPTRSGNGRYLKLEFEIIEGDFKGRRLWNNLNLENTNQDAVKMARADLSAICRAVGVMQLQDTVQLHNLPLVIVVRLRKDKDTDEMKNEIRGFESKQSFSASASGIPAAQTNVAPWARK